MRYELAATAPDSVTYRILGEPGHATSVRLSDGTERPLDWAGGPRRRGLAPGIHATSLDLNRPDPQSLAAS